MALVLSLRTGQDFFVGSKRFVVVHTSEYENDFRLIRDEDAMSFNITTKQAREIMPDVFASAGEKQQVMAVRVVIDAPRDVRVLRGSIFRNPPMDAKVLV